MLALINFLLCLAFSLAGFVAGNPFPDVLENRNVSSPDSAMAYDYLIWQNNGKALAETWVGRQAVSVGDVTGDGLYKAAKDYMEKDCGPENPRWCDEIGYWHTVYTHRISKFPNIVDTYFQMNIRAMWTSEEIRKQMVEQMALTVKQLTSTAENCYEIPGHNNQCNIGNFVFINYPILDNHENWIRLKFSAPGFAVYDKFRCCRSLNKVDEASDQVKDWASRNFRQEYSRDARCLIYDDKTCGGCGSKCDECGDKCPDVCPHGNC